jgi:enterochelin esterase-like enzyme
MIMSKYRHLELSDPNLERDHLRLLTFGSPALKRRGDVTLFLPPEVETLLNVPLVILLHGVYGSHWSWTFSGGAHLTARKLIAEGCLRPVVIAMPSDGLWGDGSGYVTHASADYEKWIMEDVAGCVTELVPALSARSPLFLSGLSMGGYGALRLGAKYAGRVSGISAHSSVTHLHQLKSFVDDSPDAEAICNSADELNVLYWMKLHRETLPPLRFDCGMGDLLIEENRQLHQALNEMQIPHTYQEFPGGHTWEYWQKHLTDTLLFFESIC